MSDPFQIEIGFEDGAVVAFVPGTDIRERVELTDHARDMAAQGQIIPDPQLLAYLRTIGGPPEVSGKLANKIKKGVKKAASSVAKGAKAVVKSKVVKGLYNTVKMVTPQPFKLGITVAEKGTGFVKKAAKPGSKQAKAVPTVKKLAAGKISPKQAEAEAKKVGVDPEDVKAAAMTVRMKEAAQQGDEGARTVIEAVEKIEGAESNDRTEESAALAFGAEAQIRAQYPDASVMRVVDPNGVERLTAVIPLS